MTTRKFPTEQELNEMHALSQKEFKTAITLDDLTYRSRFLSKTQELILKIREVKAKMNNLKGKGDVYAMTYLSNELEELRTAYKYEKKEDMERNEFSDEAYRQAGIPRPAWSFIVIADYE